MLSLLAITLVAVHAAIGIAFLVLAGISRIFGAAKRKKPLYPWFYVASGLIGLGLILSLLGMDMVWAIWVAAVVDTLGLVLGFAITWFYWDWLPRELAKG